MLLLTKKIDISLPNENKVHSFLKTIPDEEWEGWTITRKDNSANLNFNVTKTTNVGISVIKLNTVWEELIKLEPNLKKFVKLC